MRRFAAIAVSLGLLGAHAAALAGECPGNPHALGTSRILVVDPAEHSQLGTVNYSETLPLAEKEVVLTFDDGPRPPFTTRVLDVLAAECVKATFFVIGKMAEAYPAEVQRLHADGHTIGTHSYSHPTLFDTITPERARLEIELGLAATAVALGDRDAISPFFRYPGLGRTMASEAYLRHRGLMVWSADVLSDDWFRISAGEIVRRSVARLNERGRGVLLMHDIHPATAVALPSLLKRLKAEGFRIVHVVPATPDRPKTVTARHDWIAPWAAHKRWPLFAALGRSADEAELPVPDAQVFAQTEAYASPTVRVVATEQVRQTGSKGHRQIERTTHRSVVHIPSAWPASPAAAADIEPADMTDPADSDRAALPAPDRDSAGVEFALAYEAPEPTGFLGVLETELGTLRMQASALGPSAELVP
jgi:peptidoglycan/xylan/chitin deacetylase (PgdA/CDA1 family)